MSFDYDQFNDFKPATGNVATSDGSYQGVTCVAVTSAAINNATATWMVEESFDGGSTYTDVSADCAIYRMPASGTGSVFHCSTSSKAQKVRFTLKNNGTSLNNGSTPTATYTLLYGHPTSAPFLGSTISDIADGYTTPPTQ